jgi:hypothetical protein
VAANCRSARPATARSSSGVCRYSPLTRTAAAPLPRHPLVPVGRAGIPAGQVPAP